MDNLPSTNQPNPPQNPPGAATIPLVGSMAKEAAPPISSIEATPMTEVGRDVELSPEVQKAGVTIKNDSVVLPKPVAQMGVTQVNPPATVPVQPAVVLPLNDDQIALGLHQSLLSSVRWLAEWCVRQLAEAHLKLRTTQGKVSRTQT